MKNISFFIRKFSDFGGENFYIYLNRRVFVMLWEDCIRRSVPFLCISIFIMLVPEPLSFVVIIIHSM